MLKKIVVFISVFLLMLISKTSAKDSLVREKFLKIASTYIHDNHKLVEIYHSIISASKKYNTDALMIISIIYVESKFNHKAVNKNCYGLMQINTKVWKISDPLNIYQNIHKGTEIYKKYLIKRKSVEKALIAYSGGSTKYAKKVLKTYSRFKNMF